MYRNCSLILKCHRLIRNTTNKISRKNRKSKSIFSVLTLFYVCIMYVYSVYTSQEQPTNCAFILGARFVRELSFDPVLCVQYLCVLSVYTSCNVHVCALRTLCTQCVHYRRFSRTRYEGAVRENFVYTVCTLQEVLTFVYSVCTVQEVLTNCAFIQEVLTNCAFIQEVPTNCALILGAHLVPELSFETVLSVYHICIYSMCALQEVTTMVVCVYSMCALQEVLTNCASILGAYLVLRTDFDPVCVCIFYVCIIGGAHELCFPAGCIPSARTRV